MIRSPMPKKLKTRKKMPKMLLIPLAEMSASKIAQRVVRLLLSPSRQLARGSVSKHDKCVWLRKPSLLLDVVNQL